MNNIYMQKAVEEAKKAYKHNEVPVGAVIVKNNKIIAKSYNKKEKKKCAIYHAEIDAIKKAAKGLGNWRLNGCEMYVTLEPCPMCASAIKQSRIEKVFFLLENKNNEVHDLTMNILSITDANAPVEIVKCANQEEINEFITFFEKKRN